MKRLVILSLVAAMFTAATALPAQAGLSVVSQFADGEINLASDDSGDFLFNRNGLSTIIDVGDVLLATFRITTITDTTGGSGTRTLGAGTGVNEFTGLAAIEVDTKVGAGPSSFFTFKPISAAALADIIADGTLPNIAAELSGWAAGSMVAFFDDASQDYTRVFNSAYPGPDDGNSPETAAADPDIGVGPFLAEDRLAVSAINGTPIFEIGFTGPSVQFVNNYWNATGPDDISLLDLAILPGVTSGNVNFGLNATANSTGKDFLPLTPGGPEFSGNGPLQSTGPLANTPYDGFDEVNIFFMPTPEPSSFIIWGALGLVGGVTAYRRTRRKSA